MVVITPFKSAWSAIQQWLMLSPSLARVALALSLLGAVLGVFSLAAAAGNNQAWAQHYNQILWANIIVIVLLLGLVLALLTRLLWRLKKSRFGARLTLQFAGAFAILGFFPGLLVYLISVLFLSQSVDSWFNVKVDSALEAGLELSRTAINSQLQTLTQKARNAANSMDAAQSYGDEAQRIRYQYAERGTERSTERGTEKKTGKNVDKDIGKDIGIGKDTGKDISKSNEKSNDLDVLFFNQDLRVLASTGSMTSKGLLSDTPLGTDLVTLKKQGTVSVIESIPNADGETVSEQLYLRAVVAVAKPEAFVPSNFVDGQKHYLQLTQPVSAKVTQLAQAVAQGSKNYETLLLGRTGLRKIYGATLTIALLLAVLAAVAAGFVMADAMSAPLLRLARATQAVAAGDFSPLPQPVGKDDLAVLTRSFNRMLTELGSARGALTQSNTFLNEVLTQLSTGVLVLDAQQALRSINPSAQSILGLTQLHLNTAAQDQLPGAVWATLAQQGSKTHWQQQIEHVLDNGATQHLLLRGAPLAQSDGIGTLLVFDDVSDVMLAQKSQAWSEVARRLAHEIKNPLTPIQLSAERLAMKLGDKLTGKDADLLKRGIATIVTQVAALKTMVDEFRHYARLPQALLAPLSLNALVNDVLMLYKGKVVAALDAQDDRVLADAGQITQVLHNLLGNAIDAAHAAHPDDPQACQVIVSTEDIAQGTALCVRDNGAGFSPEAMNKLFEPYHTSKSHGTGLGLAIVHRIVQDHKASIRVKNVLGDAGGTAVGAQVTLVFSKVVVASQENQVLQF